MVWILRHILSLPSFPSNSSPWSTRFFMICLLAALHFPPVPTHSWWSSHSDICVVPQTFQAIPVSGPLSCCFFFQECSSHRDQFGSLAQVIHIHILIFFDWWDSPYSPFLTQSPATHYPLISIYLSLLPSNIFVHISVYRLPYPFPSAEYMAGHCLVQNCFTRTTIESGLWSALQTNVLYEWLSSVILQIP